jgi:hypothetical protein
VARGTRDGAGEEMSTNIRRRTTHPSRIRWRYAPQVLGTLTYTKASVGDE